MILKDGRDTRDLDPNELGELMRNALFERSLGLGCYKHFDVREGWMQRLFDEFAFGMVAERNSGIDGADREDDAHIFQNGMHFTHIDKPIDAAWYWDGDGTLTFLVDRRAIINTDCKKTNNWREWNGTGAFQSAVQELRVLEPERNKPVYGKM